MKKRKIVAAGLVLLILFNLLSACASIRFGATLYNDKDVEEWLDEAFLKENPISGARYPNENYTGPHGSEPSTIRYPDAPKTRVFIITDGEEYEKIIPHYSIEVDFEKQMVILYTFSVDSSRDFNLKSVKVNDGALTVKIKQEASNVLDGSMPGQGWVMLTMKKMEISEVKFEEI